MKKITLALIFLIGFYGVAQDTCATAVPVSVGITTVGTINGTDVPTPICALNGPVPITNGPAGEWYSFTPTQDGIYNITTNLPQNAGGDTRVHIYTGTCGNLTCEGGNDDVDGTNFLSDAFFQGVSGVMYYIAWDNRWSNLGFDFELSLEPNLNCDDITVFPFSEDWNNTTNPSGTSAFKWDVCWTKENLGTGAGWTFNGANDFDGDGINDNIINIFPQETPPATAPAKNAWAISPGILMSSSSNYDITITYNAVDVNFTANESFDLVILDDNNLSAATQTVLNSFTNITMQGTFAGPPNLFDAALVSTESFTPASDGVFYLGVHVNSPAGGDVFFVKEILIEETTLSIGDFDQNQFNFFVDANNTLNLEATNIMEQLQVFNIVGQQVINTSLNATEAQVSVNALKPGVYLGKLQLEGENRSFKFVKR
ncbi:MAG: T9SS type A sorting domain-containing protein [Flavobacteriaceae bacterium]|nr:T9SS type A sorting domain-containing protein [Flavobacteriaceae bacterium]